MPYVPFVPSPGIPIVTPMGATGGAGTFTAIDYSASVAQIGVQLSQIQYYLSGGPAGAAMLEQGSLPNLMGQTAKSLANIDSALQTLVLGNNKQVGAQLSGANSVQSSLSTIAGLLTTMIAMQQMSLADQIKHNEFQETATNTARQEQDPTKAPIGVPSATLVAKIQDATKNIATIQSIAGGAGIATGLATDALAQGASLAKNLVASTGVGQTIIGYGTQVKSYIATQVADIEAAAKKKQIEAEAAALKLKAQTGST